MTPLGHASISLILGNRLKRNYFFSLLADSLVPDIDFILLTFPFFNYIHRYITHFLFIIVISGIILFFLIRNEDYKWLILLFYLWKI